MDQPTLNKQVKAAIREGEDLVGVVKAGKGEKADVEAFRFIQRSKKEFEVAIWNYVRQCKGQECPIWDFCPYKSLDVPCEMERTYMAFLIKLIYKLIDDERLTEQGALIAGYHLVPLYKHLFKFKLFEMGNDTLFVGNSQFVQVHPVYKEIRNITSAIIKTWTTIANVTKIEAIPDQGLLMKKASTPPTDMSQDGMGYYEALSASDVSDAKGTADKIVTSQYKNVKAKDLSANEEE